MIDVDNSSSFSIDEVNVKSYITQMLKFLKVNTNSDVSVLFVDEDEMTKQHVRWMNESGPTDVMSFPMDDIVLQDSKLRKKQAILGDIIICPAVTGTAASTATASIFAGTVNLLSGTVLVVVIFVSLSNSLTVNPYTITGVFESVVVSVFAPVLVSA